MPGDTEQKATWFWGKVGSGDGSEGENGSNPVRPWVSWIEQQCIRDTMTVLSQGRVGGGKKHLNCPRWEYNPQFQCASQVSSWWVWNSELASVEMLKCWNTILSETQAQKKKELNSEHSVPTNVIKALFLLALNRPSRSLQVLSDKQIRVAVESGLCCYCRKQSNSTTLKLK